MLTYSEERALLEDIKEGVEIALYEVGVPAENIDDIKLNKLVYFIIREFDLNITYGWYKYGPAPVDVSDAGGGSDSADLTLKSPSEIRASRRSRVPSQKHEHSSPVEYAEFLVEFEEFEKIIGTATKEYLLGFYEDNAPPKYKNLYVQCTHLQRSLDQFATESDWENVDDDSIRQLDEEINRVYGELLKISELEESVSAFRDYKRFFKNTISTAAAQEEITERQEQFIEGAVRFFYQNTWRYPALLISKDTVTGDNTDRLRTSIEDQLADLRLRHGEDLNRLSEHSRLLGLQPNSARKIKQAEQYSSADEINKTDQLERWTELASEVINE